MTDFHSLPLEERQDIGPFLVQMAERTPDSMRRHMMKALVVHFPLGAVAVAFRATEDEMEYMKAGPVYEHEPVDEVERLRRLDYRTEYLKTPHWQKVKARALEAAEGRCQINSSHPAPFDVHHRDYGRLGCERASDVVVMCRGCHDLYHDRMAA